MNKELLQRQLIEDEGLKLFPYKDTIGIFTIGVGRNLESKGLSKDELFFLGIRATNKQEVISILLEKGLSKEDCLYLLDNDIDEVIAQLKKQFSWFDSKPDAVQRVLCNMCFNMGLGGLLKFKKTLDFIRLDKYEEAAKEMLDSLWSKQVGSRAIRLSNLLRAQANTTK